MEEFNKWWDDNGNDYCDEGGANYEECATAAWTAALAWAQKMMNENILNEALPKVN